MIVGRGAEGVGSVQIRGVALQIRNEAGDLPNSKALSEMVDLTLARSGEQFSIPDALIVLARWGHFTDLGLPWENAVAL